MARRGGVVLGVVAAAAACLGLLASTAGGSSTSQRTSLDLSVLAQLNQIRTQHGLRVLALSAGLSDAAAQHSQEMVADGYFAHSSADGTPFWKRIRDYYPPGSTGTWSVGENLFWASGKVSATESVGAWMASPPHRANILDPAWRQIGIAAIDSMAAPGTFGGAPVTVITTDFGVRR
jgi:uncharacterized protein YkwD